MRIGLTLSLAVLLFGNAAAQAPSERDWGKALAEDAQALHDDIAANHPGSVNTLDPEFAVNNDRQLAIALETAKTAKTYGDYFYPLRLYVSSFNDGHMSFGAFGNTPNQHRWPGFATHYDGTGAIVVATDEPGAPVPKGARLIGCDGLTAAQYAEATLGKMWGNWALESQRRSRGWSLFIDERSGLIPVSRQCTFGIGDVTKTVELTWQPLAIDVLIKMIDGLMQRPQRNFSTRRLADGTQWVALPSFNGNPGSPAVKAIPGMIAAIERDRTTFAAAPAIVLDLRGNGGGTSDWSQQIAVALWGQAALDALPVATEVHVDWRASPANLAAIATAYGERQGSNGFSPGTDRWYRSAIAGLGFAIARKQALWRHVAFEAHVDNSQPATKAKKPMADPPPKLSGPVYVLTDFACMSACLDAVDLWTALGAEQIGQATGADTLYMENRSNKLPNGLTGGSMPMKVYRGRNRGSNVPAVPVERFSGDIGDTKALEQWVSTLPKRRSR